MLHRLLICATLAGAVGGCDTASPEFDYKVGQTEAAAGRGTQGAGVVVATAPDVRTKAAGAGLVGVGIVLEEDGKNRMERAESRMHADYEAVAP